MSNLENRGRGRPAGAKSKATLLLESLMPVIKHGQLWQRLYVVLIERQDEIMAGNEKRIYRTNDQLAEYIAERFDEKKPSPTAVSRAFSKLCENQLIKYTHPGKHFSYSYL